MSLGGSSPTTYIRKTMTLHQNAFKKQSRYKPHLAGGISFVDLLQLNGSTPTLNYMKHDMTLPKRSHLVQLSSVHAYISF